jgi:PAS domain S-box-containing protein
MYKRHINIEESVVFPLAARLLPQLEKLAIAEEMTKRGSSVLAVPAVTKDGRRISIEFSVVLLTEPTGGVVGIAAFLQDVTQRWERDKALRVRLAAAEALAQGH